MSKVQTLTQVSAGGVAYRRQGEKAEVALISVGPQSRWQLPKGIVDEGETPESAAVREVREEAGIETSVVAFIDKVEYWYFSTLRGARVRYHKFVHFYLLEFLSGDVSRHDREVNEARWVEVSEAVEMLAFKGEKKMVELANAMLRTSDS
ncbi:MAG TPA: NUDIX domain-containing protein [Blastocatellia bacterium]|nr:NUDIX domain-containing protein [Blastocatellia bacterium]